MSHAYRVVTVRTRRYLVWRTRISDKWVIARNTVAAAGARFLQLASSFIFMPFLIRSFGLEYYGVYIIAGSLSVYMQLLDFGVDSAATKYIAEYRAKHDQEHLQRIASNVLAYYAFAGVVATLLVVTLALFGMPLLRLTAPDESMARNLFLVSGAISLFVWPLNTGTVLLNGMQRYDLTATVGMGITVGNVIVTAAALAFGEGPVTLLALQGVVAIAGAGTALHLALRQMREARPSPALVDRATLGILLGFSWKLFVLQVATLLSNQQTDRLVLLLFRGPTSVGLYEAPSKLSSLMTHVIGLPSTALVPAASHFWAGQRTHELRSLFVRGTKYTIAFSAPIALTLIVLARPLLLHWIGPEFVALTFASQLLLANWLVHANLQVAVAILIGMKRVDYVLACTVGIALLNVAVSVTLVKPLGVLGVVIGSVAADLVVFPLLMRHVLQTLGTPAGEYFRRVAIPGYGTAALAAVAALALSGLGLVNSLASVGVAGIACVASAWLAFFAVGIDASERSDARELARRVVRRFAA